MEELKPKARAQAFSLDNFKFQMAWIADKLACLWQRYYEGASLGEKTCWAFAGSRAELYKTVPYKLKLAFPAKPNCPVNDWASKMAVGLAEDGSVCKFNIHLIKEWDEGFDIVEVERRIREHVFSSSPLFILFVNFLSCLKEITVAVC